MGWIAERRERQAEAATIELNQLLGEGWDSEESLAAAHAASEREEQEISEYWERVATTPWHKRGWGAEHLLQPPVSRWGRAIYYAALPFVFVAMLLSNVLLFAWR